MVMPIVIGILTACAEIEEASKQEVRSGEQEEIDVFARQVRTTLTRLEEVMFHCGDEEEVDKNAKRQLENIHEDFDELNDHYNSLCEHELELTYFQAYQESFFKEQLENPKLDKQAEEQIIIIMSDLRDVLSQIYPIKTDASIFYSLEDWELENMKIPNKAKFCSIAKERLGGELPNKIIQGERRVDEAELEFDIGDFSPA
ncbi:hypothetical protein [Natranaerobius thermophilus]|uniref:hypothetical protein n=1 Tax=Natranaerobius thermophilus TaxID=375929 RepID=UPI00059D25B1